MQSDKQRADQAEKLDLEVLRLKNELAGIRLTLRIKDDESIISHIRLLKKAW